MIQIREWASPASSGEGEILSRLWAADTTPPAAVIQIAHGMAEHSGRYDDFARYLAENGFVVCMNDHAGHGGSIRVKGHFADTGGWEYVVHDMRRLMEEMGEQYPDLPVFLMGHSMGSFLARSYIVRYQGLSGCVLSGTMGPNPMLKLVRALAALQKKTKGPQSEGKLLARMVGGQLNRRIDHPASENAWLSTVEEVAAVYDADPNCGFRFTASGYYDLMSGLIEVNAPGWAKKVPQDLPLFVFSGAEDPVGDYGNGPMAVYAALNKTDHDVELKLYPGKRHEMLNESNRQEVYADVLGWLQKKMGKA